MDEATGQATAATPEENPAAQATVEEPEAQEPADLLTYDEPKKEAPDGCSPAQGEATKPGDEKKAEAVASADPEKYEFKFPEGYELNEALIAEVTPLLRELKCTPEQAQKLADVQVKAMTLVEQERHRLEGEVIQGWQKAVMDDPELGGSKMPEQLAMAKRGLNAVGSPALGVFLAQTHLGSHPEIIRAFAKVGKLVSEDRFVEGGGAAARDAGADAAHVLYGSPDKQ